jgi:hypothetical protein
MSDFLAHLVERSRDEAAPEIRPRIPSAFEASAAGDENPALLPIVAEDEPTAQRRTPALQPPVYRGPLAAPTAAAPPPAPAPPTTGEREAAGDGFRPPTPNDNRRQVGPTAGIPSAVQEASRVPGTPTEPVQVIRVVTTRPEAAPAAVAAAAPVPPHPRPPAIEPRIVRAEPRRESDAPGRDPATGASEREGPIIRVSIGRIEVRAVTGPSVPPPPPRWPVPAPLGIEEYLRQRMRGER